MVRQQKISVAKNAGEQIIEIMRDAAGELADFLHLLLLRDLLLQRALLGRVDCIYHDRIRATAVPLAGRGHDVQAARAFFVTGKGNIQRRRGGSAFCGIGDHLREWLARVLIHEVEQIQPSVTPLGRDCEGL